MIMNEQNLNTKERELVESLNEFFINENFGEFDVYADFSTITNIEFKGKLFRLVLRIKPYEPDCEEQLQISTIIFDNSIRHKGIFQKLMIKLVEFCKQYKNMPILFCEVVSENFATKLMNYGGILLRDSFYSGKYIAILPEKLNEK
ncbi:hypothetical protein [Clostridium guangxiense]|uniref:hypothetical protein n=1 Tax=Clostridium guangxiense TaxID=1662055 RepID=UPI001E5B0D17|nr:hypothetical protein [Clostridium guangxiense]MCD2348878.1 hypothetical protein [Clostridium guangxiense]